MNNTKGILSKLVIFTVGAAIGSAVTWKFLDKKYQKRSDDEIESVKKRLLGEDCDISDPEDAPGMYYEHDELSSQELYEKTINENGYSYSKHKKEEDEMADKPYVISPEEFGEIDYPTITLWCYADGVVTNERNKIVTNVDELIGLDSLNHFGEYEPDAVHVRNDIQEIDYEILKDRRNFSEIS